MKSEPNARLIAGLEVSSGFLDDLSRLWDRVRNGISDTRAASIYETKLTPTVRVNY